MEASGAACGRWWTPAVDREVVVRKQLRVEVRGQRRVEYSGSLAHLAPRLHVLVVDRLCGALEAESLHRRGCNIAGECGLDAEYLLENLVDGALVRIAAIGQVVHGLRAGEHRNMPQRADNIRHVHLRVRGSIRTMSEDTSR
eukprot:3904781-Prymnesium_polylepis.1